MGFVMTELQKLKTVRNPMKNEISLNGAHSTQIFPIVVKSDA